MRLSFSILFTVSFIVSGCTKSFNHNDSEAPVTDSISFYLQKSKSMPDHKGEEALIFAEKAWQLARREPTKQSVMFEICYNLGVQAEKVGKYDLAMTYFREVERINGFRLTATAIDVYSHIGNIAFKKGINDIAMEYFSKALEISTQLNDQPNNALLYLNIGAVHQSEGKLKEAQEKYDKSLLLFTMLKDEVGKATCYNYLGILWKERKYVDMSIEYFQQAEEILEKNYNIEILLDVYRNLGNAYNIKGDFEKAHEYYVKMLKPAQTLSSTILAETYYYIGTFFHENNNTDSAIFYYSKAIEIAVPLKLFETQHLSLINRGLVYAWKKNFLKAYNDCEASRIAYDSIVSIYTTKALMQQTMLYEFTMQLQQQHTRNSIMWISIIALSIVIVIGCTAGYLLYRSYTAKNIANALLAKQQEEISESIRYASLIQNASLPSKEYVNTILPEHFIFFKPRDIVSGDFYWINTIGHFIIVAAADCTGHGVPGAIVSMLGISSLNKITYAMKKPKANDILNKMRKDVIGILNPKGSMELRHDGIDIALAIIDTAKKEIEFAGAYNPMYLIRNDQLLMIEADRMPVGLYIKDKVSFKSSRFHYEKNDVIYMFSDGYSDQFGGSKGKKFKTQNFKKLLLEISKKPMQEQLRAIEHELINWKGSHSQVDDILVFGIRLE